jgi:hypothetical protein
MPDLERQRILRLIAEIENDLADIQNIVSEGERVRQKFKQREPTAFELRACASILQDFYNGIEGIFTKIAGEVNGGLPAGEDWHKKLLVDMGIQIPDLRPPVLSKKMCEQLDEYLRFRHLFRHSYGVSLQWDRVMPLLASVRRTFIDFSKQAERFGVFLRKMVSA